MSKHNTKTKPANTQPETVWLATRNPTNDQLAALLVERGLPVPVPATKKSLVAALVAAGVQLSATASIVPLAAKARYAAHGGTCGDELAEAFAAVDPALWAQVATQNGVDFGRWSHLNPGQQRMNLGNVLRGKLRRGEQVRVLDETFGAAE